MLQNKNISPWGQDGKVVAFPNQILCRPNSYQLIGVKKEQQDLYAPLSDHYIRHVMEIPAAAQEKHDEDEPVALGMSNLLRIVICMSQEGSEQLLKVQYPSSDISFKRVNDYYEFEIASIDQNLNTSKRLTQYYAFSLVLISLQMWFFAKSTSCAKQLLHIESFLKRSKTLFGLILGNLCNGDISMQTQ
jgi:hypothetical protein